MENNSEFSRDMEFIALLMEMAGPQDACMPDSLEESPEEDGYEEEDRTTEDDIARENGFWVDDDGDWQPLPDDDDWW